MFSDESVDIYGRKAASDIDEEYDRTFFYPEKSVRSIEFDALVDWDAVDKYLPKRLQEVVSSHIFPIRVAGDGNCLLRAVSFALWGSEDYYFCLRELLIIELKENFEWYVEKTKETSTKESEWKDSLQIAQTPSAYLGSPHIFALANVIQRTIVLYASDRQVQAFGETEDGVAGTFLPSRHEKKNWLDKPIIPIAWSSDSKNHFIPLIGVENNNIEWPIVHVAFNQNILNENELRDIFRNARRIEPKIVNELRNGKNVNHLRKGNENQTMDNVQVIKVGGKLYAVRGNNFSFEEEEEETPARLYLNGRYLIWKLGRSSTLSDIPEFIQRNSLPEYYEERLTAFAIQTINGDNVNDSLLPSSYKKKKIPQRNEVTFLRTDFYNHFPLKKYFVYNDTKSLEKLISKLSSSLSLSSEELHTLCKMKDLIRAYESHMKVSAKIPFTQDIPCQYYELLIRLLKVDSRLIFPVFDLARLFIMIPKVADFFANAMKDVNNPFNLFALVFPVIQYVNDKSYKGIVQTLSILLLNMFQSSVLLPELVHYGNLIVRTIDKCITNYANIPIFRYFGKLLTCLAKNVSTHEDETPLKLQIIHCCVKMLSIYHIENAKDKLQKDIISVNYDCIQAIATICYFDGIVQAKILTTNIRWPVEDIIAATQGKSEEFVPLRELAKELHSLLEKPRYIENIKKKMIETFF